MFLIKHTDKFSRRLDVRKVCTDLSWKAPFFYKPIEAMCKILQPSDKAEAVRTAECLHMAACGYQINVTHCRLNPNTTMHSVSKEATKVAKH